MTVLFYMILLGLLSTGAVWLFVSTPPARLAKVLTLAVPAILVAAGAGLMLIGRGGIGVPLIAIGMAIWQRTRSMGRMGSTAGKKSTVRSAALDMELDHDSGEMDGRILIGEHEGKWLSVLGEEDLLELYAQVNTDLDSAALLEAYLDRRFVTWREHANAHPGDGQGAAAGSGSMTKQEAYQVLGLEPGATPAEIRKAWRKLMKTMHPDTGGSEFLAAKINAAKDVLLN
jgi:hypothetical protein